MLGVTAVKAIEAMIASAWRPEQGMFAGLVGVVTLLIAASDAMVELRRALDVMFDRIVTARSILSAFVRARPRVAAVAALPPRSCSASARIR